MKDIGLYLLSFLFTGMTYDIFCCFGTTGNAKKQLKISDIGITKEEIAC